MIRCLLPLFAFLVLISPVHAAEPLPGDACTAANNLQFSSGPEVASGGGHAMLCQGGTWKAILSFDSAAGLTQLGNQTCATSEILKFDGTTWACAADAVGSSVWLDGGSGKLYYNGGNVGIGITNPTSKLEVVGNIAASSTTASSIVSTNTSLSGGVAQLYLGNTGAGGANWAINAGNTATGVLGANLGISEGSDYRFVIMQGGNVGIGTTTPVTKLNAQGIISSSVAANQRAFQIFDTATGAGTFNIFGGDSTGGSVVRLQTVNTNGFTIETGGVERLRVAASGNVGIGTANPANKLSVGSLAGQSNALITARRSSAGEQTALEWGHENNAGYASTIGQWAGGGQSFVAFNAEGGSTSNTFRTRGIVGRILMSQNNGDLAIGTAAAASADNQVFTDQVRILANGNVGVGTTSPGQKLTVAGTIESTSGGIKFPDGSTQTTAASGGGTLPSCPDGDMLIRQNGLWQCSSSISSCKAILTAGNSTGSGLYYIYPSSFSSSVQVYCDMTTNGGGWTLVAKSVVDNADFDNSSPTWESGVAFNEADLNLWTGNNSLYQSYSTVKGGDVLVKFESNGTILLSNLSTNKSAKELATSHYAAQTYTASCLQWHTVQPMDASWNMQGGSMKSGTKLSASAQARFGIIADNVLSTYSSGWDSGIGFGLTGPAGAKGSGNLFWAGSTCGNYGSTGSGATFYKAHLYIR